MKDVEQVRLKFVNKDVKIQHFETWEKFLATVMLLVPLIIGGWLTVPVVEWFVSLFTGKPHAPILFARTAIGFLLSLGSIYIIERLFDDGWLLVKIRKMASNVIPFPRRPRDK